MPIDNPQLREKLRAGDREAIQLVVHTYLEQVLRTARGAGLGLDRAEDVTQETFVTFIEKAPSFDGRSHVRTWLFGILYRKILEAHRADKRQDQMDDIDEVVERRFKTDGGWLRPPQPVDTELNNAELRQQIEDCLENVPIRQQLAFVLREVEDFSMNEIGEILQLTRSNLGVALHRGRNRLRECLEAKGLGGSSHAEV